MILAISIVQSTPETKTQPRACIDYSTTVQVDVGAADNMYGQRGLLATLQREQRGHLPHA